MRAIRSRLAEFLGSLAGRLAVLLVVGTTAAAIGSIFLAEKARQHDFERVRIERAAVSTADIASRLWSDPTETRALLTAHAIWGARHAPTSLQVTAPDPALSKLLEQHLGVKAQAIGQAVGVEGCYRDLRTDMSRRAAGIVDVPVIDCWLVQYRDPAGQLQRLTIDLPSLKIPASATLDPLYLLIVLGTSLVLSAIVAKLATTPLRNMTKAAEDFSLSLDPEPMPEKGPSEVRTALRTINLMQSRIRAGYGERIQILAAISHDLQTPLTRLRLRLEQVEDTCLRDKLITDLAATQAMVRDGLELAQSSESREDWSTVEIDSVLASLAEDAGEFGAAVAFTSGCGANVRVKFNALVRCLSNLIDNAVKYGGNADLACRLETDALVIEVRDHGEGIAEEHIAKMFEPFVRGESSRSRATGGTGIGLTIARAQARTFGGQIALQNHPEGGLVASLTIDKPDILRRWATNNAIASTYF